MEEQNEEIQALKKRIVFLERELEDRNNMLDSLYEQLTKLELEGEG